MKSKSKLIVLIGLTLFLSLTSYGQKQSLYAQYPGLIFREVFNDEASTRMNTNTYSGIIFSQGNGIFSGATTSYLTYTKKLSSTFTIRTKFKVSASGSRTILSAGNWGYWIANDNLLRFSTGVANPTITSALINDTYYVIDCSFDGATYRLYINGVLNNSTNAAFPTTNISPLYIGRAYNTTGENFIGSIDWLEIYNRALSASEISNLYNGVAHKDLTITPLIDFDSRTGEIQDNTGKTITNTATTIKRAGSIWSADFNGSTSKLDYGNIDPLTGDITICGWVKARGLGENNAGRIIDNGSIVFYCGFSGTQKFFFSSDASTTITSAANSFFFSKCQFIVLTRTSAGVTNFYIGDYRTPPTLSGTANQSSGTPLAGSTNIIIGNKSNSIATWNGLISQLKIFKSILTQAQINQIWSNSVGGYYGD